MNFDSFYTLLTYIKTAINMIFAVLKEGNQWSLDFGPQSVNLAVKHLIKELTGSSDAIPLPAWNLLFSQKQKFLGNHLDQISITPNQQGTYEMSEEFLASDGAQDMNRSVYELPDSEGIDFFWENPQVELDAVFRPVIDTPFSPTGFNDLEMGEGGSSEKPIVLDEEEDKEDYLHTTSVLERPIEPPRLLRSCLFGRQIENVSEFAYKSFPE